MTSNTRLPNHILFKIDAGRCDLCIGDRVMPDTVIGEDCRTGELMKAGYHGVIDAINDSAEDRAIFVWISPSRRASQP